MTIVAILSHPLGGRLRYESVTKAAERMGGKAHGVGIIGAVVSPGLRVVAEGPDSYGKARGWTDHPAYFLDIRATKEK